MSEPNPIRDIWHKMQLVIGEQQHPIHTGDTLYPLSKLPIITEDKWTIERLRVESDIEAALEEMDAGSERVPAENRWRQIKHATYLHVAGFRADRDRLVAEGHIDNRHIDPNLATDEEVSTKADALAARLAEIEALSDDDLREAVETMRQEMEQFRKDGLEAYARKLMSNIPNAPELPIGLDEAHDGIFERLAELENKVEERSGRLCTLEADVRMPGGESSGGGQRPFAQSAAGAGFAAISVVIAFCIGGWMAL